MPLGSFAQVEEPSWWSAAREQNPQRDPLTFSLQRSSTPLFDELGFSFFLN
jgi:hypothetical protein